MITKPFSKEPATPILRVENGAVSLCDGITPERAIEGLVQALINTNAQMEEARRGFELYCDLQDAARGK